MMTEYGVFLSAENKTTITSVEDLQGLHVGVFGPSNTSNSLEDLNAILVDKGLKPMKIMIQRDESGNLMRMLDSNRIDAYYSNRSLGSFVQNSLVLRALGMYGKTNVYLYFNGIPQGNKVQQTFVFSIRPNASIPNCFAQNSLTSGYCNKHQSI